MAHILVVDDDPVLRRLVTLALERAGHTVLACENGRQAIQYLGQGHTDLLITDIIMPEMDGVETVRAARRLRPDLPILAMSGGGSFEPGDYLKIAQTFGATAILPKPFHPPALAELVAKLVAG